MPKVKWLPATEPKINHLAALFFAYRKARGMTSKDIAEQIGCSDSNARVQMNKPGREWQIGQLLRYCDVLGIPYTEALEAAIK